MSSYRERWFPTDRQMAMAKTWYSYRGYWFPTSARRSRQQAWACYDQAQIWRRQYNRQHNDHYYWAPGSHEEEVEAFRWEHWDDIGPDDDD